MIVRILNAALECTAGNHAAEGHLAAGSCEGADNADGQALLLTDLRIVYVPHISVIGNADADALGAVNGATAADGK